MAEFLSAQLDYVFFFYGLAFLMMAEVCYTMSRQEYQRLPWLWLGLFGVAHGFNEWLELLSTGVADSQGFAIARSLVAAVSFVFLAEFGRMATARLAGAVGGVSGRWALAPLVLLAALGGLAGLPVFAAASRYSLALVGGLWSAYALWLASKRFTSGRGWLAASAAGMGLYALASGFVVSPADFFPANTINTASFLSATGVPIQLVRGLLAVFMAFSVRGYYRTHCIESPAPEGYAQRPRCSFVPLFTVLAIVLLGWFFTEAAGQAGQLTRPVPVYRLFSISMVLVLCVLSLAFFVLSAQAKESAARGAALRVAMLKLAEEKRLRDITSAIGEGVFVQDAAGLVTFMNPEAERLLGWTEAELKGKDFCGIAGCRDEAGRPTPREACPAHRALLSETVSRVDDAIFSRKDGSLFHVSFVSSPIREDGRVVGSVTAFQDITARVNLEHQRSEFYAMVTHDLKSPLTAALGYSELLLDKEKPLDAEDAAMVAGIQQSCNKLLRMVENFLTISRLEYGHIYLNLMLVDVAGLLGELSREYSALSAQAGLEFACNVPAGLPKAVIDRDYVQRAVSNLLQNAVNYTPRGGSVTLSAWHEPGPADGSIVVSVADTGRGIEPEDQEKVFEMYYRSKRAGGTKGSGLGLAIVKAVAAAHGGRIELTSQPGKGSTFRLILPTKTG